jgi:hypothetical protein
MKYLTFLFSIVFMNCASDDLCRIKDASDKEAFKNSGSLYKEGNVWTELPYAGYGTALLNGEKILIYPQLSHSKNDSMFGIGMLLFSTDLSEMKGNILTLEVNLNVKSNLIYLNSKDEYSTIFSAKPNQCYSFGLYHLKDNSDYKSFIKVVDFDEKNRLKARFNMVFEVDEASIKDIDKAGLPHEIILSDGIVMAGFLPKTE